MELKREKCGNDPSTLDAVSGISKIGLSAVLHVKIGVVKADVNGCICIDIQGQAIDSIYCAYSSNTMNERIRRCEAGGSTT